METKLQNKQNETDRGNIPASQVAAAVPIRAIPIKKDVDSELISEAFKLICRKATTTISMATYSITTLEAFANRGIPIWSGGDGAIIIKYSMLRYDWQTLLQPYLIGCGVNAKDLNAVEWRFGTNLTTLTLSDENMRHGLTPENLGRMLKRTLRVAIQSNDCPVLVRYSVDKYGNRRDIEWIKSFSNTAGPYYRYMGHEPVTVFNSVADFRDAGGIAPKIDRRYYYAAA